MASDTNEITEKQRKRFEQLFMRAFPKVKAFAWKLLQDEDEAEDVAQDVFVLLWKNPELWAECELRNTYLYTVTRNSVFDLLKHRTVIQKYQEHEKAHTTSLASPDFHDEIYAEELELIIKLQLENMPEQRKRVFTMSRQEGLSNQKIAETLGISIRTVEHHIYLALQELKKSILFTSFIFLL